MELTATFMALLEGFQSVFTAPSLATFRLLMTGWILSVRHRYVTNLIVSSDSTRNGHFSDYHRFFSHAVWNLDDLGKCLAVLIVNTLVDKEETIVLAGLIYKFGPSIKAFIDKVAALGGDGGLGEARPGACCRVLLLDDERCCRGH